MKKPVFLATLALLLPATTALADTSVWKVSRGGATLYLGGTCHLLRPADLPLPPEYDQAYAAAQKVYFETDIARVMSPEMQQIISTRGLYGPGQSLDAAIDAEAWRRIQDYCAKTGLPTANVSRMKPWLFIVMVSAMEMQKLGVTQEGADVIYFKRAKADGKPVGSLESFEAHIDFLTGMGAGKESEIIRSSLDDLAQAIEDFPKLLAAWRAGDLAAVEKEMLQEMRTKYPDIFKELIVTRNNAWLSSIDDMLKSPETELVLAGFGHMAGPEGLIAQLRQRGCEVTQLTAAK
jgi:uncharacterized protein YbaP (TraB family)